MSANFTPWGWGTQNLCAKTGTDSGAGSCVNFRKSSTSLKKPLTITSNFTTTFLHNNKNSNSLKTVAFCFVGGIINSINYNLGG